MFGWFNKNHVMEGGAATSVVVGVALTAQQSAKSLEEVDLAKLSPVQVIGIVLVFAGLFLFALAFKTLRDESAKAAQQASAEVAAAGKESAELFGRREAYRDIRTKLNGHKALDDSDIGFHLGLVRASAMNLREEMSAIATDDPNARALASAISNAAISFVTELEEIERESGLRFDDVKVEENVLTEPQKVKYRNAHRDWQTRTRDLSTVAASMIGLDERRW